MLINNSIALPRLFDIAGATLQLLQALELIEKEKKAVWHRAIFEFSGTRVGMHLVSHINIRPTILMTMFLFFHALKKFKIFMCRLRHSKLCLQICTFYVLLKLNTLLLKCTVFYAICKCSRSQCFL